MGGLDAVRSPASKPQPRDSWSAELFRVIYNGGAYNGTAVRPQGIITTIALSGTPRGTSQAASQYRTDCAIIQKI
jgi:hypothetical protein